MKNRFLPIFAVFLVLAGLLFAATAPTYTQSPDYLCRVQTDPTFSKDGSLATCLVNAFFRATFTNTQDPTDFFPKDLGSVNIDCVKEAEKEVKFTFSGKDYDLPYGAIAAGMAAAQEWAGKKP